MAVLQPCTVCTNAGSVNRCICLGAWLFHWLTVIVITENGWLITEPLNAFKVNSSSFINATISHISWEYQNLFICRYICGNYKHYLPVKCCVYTPLYNSKKLANYILSLVPIKPTLYTQLPVNEHHFGDTELSSWLCRLKSIRTNPCSGWLVFRRYLGGECT
jgi:hypothetical protein